MLRGIALWFIAYWQRRCKQKINNKLAEWKWTFIDYVQLIHRCMQRNVIAAVVRCRPHAALFARKHIHWCNKCMMIVYILLYFVPLFIRCGRSPPVCVAMVFIALRLQNRWNTEIAVSVFFLSGSNIYANPLRFACLDDVVTMSHSYRSASVLMPSTVSISHHFRNVQFPFCLRDARNASRHSSLLGCQRIWNQLIRPEKRFKSCCVWPWLQWL